MARPWRWLLIPLAVYLFLSLIYLFAIPVGESPDEPGHLQCIEQVAVYQRLPITEPAPEGENWWSRGRILSGRMCYHMPLYYLATGTVLRTMAKLSNSDLVYEFPPSNERFGAEAAMFEHDEPSLWLLQEPPTLVSIRILSILLGAVTVVGSFALSLQFFPRKPEAAILAGMLAAGWPQLAYLSRAISNDALASALAILTLLVLSQTGQPRRFIVLAILTSLAVLTKISVTFVVGVVIAAWLIEFAVFKNERPAYLRGLVLAAIIWLATIILLTVHPVLRDHLRSSSSSFSGFSEQVLTLSYWQNFFVLTLSSGWARLGWMNLPAPLWHAYIWWGFLIIACAAGLILIWRHSQTNEQRILLLICLIWVAAVFLSYLRININRLQPQFRFMVTAVPVLTVWAATGPIYLAKERSRLQWVIIGGVTAFLVAYNLWFVLTIVQGAYSA